jgi:hypothetical protein
LDGVFLVNYNTNFKNCETQRFCYLDNFSKIEYRCNQLIFQILNTNELIFGLTGFNFFAKLVLYKYFMSRFLPKTLSSINTWWQLPHYTGSYRWR